MRASSLLSLVVRASSLHENTCMTAILIYLFPALMDMILSAVLFMCTVSAAQQGLKASKVSNIITTWAVVYMVVALLLSRVVTPRNARKLIIFSCAMTTGLSLLLARTTDINALYILVALEGVAMACFFVPFQVFMKSVGEGHRKSINYSVGLYTFSWSMGYAAGPFVAGLMWQYVGWRDSHLINAAAALAVGVMTWMIKHKAHPTAVLDDAAPQLLEDQAQASPDYSSMPDLAWMGWVFSGLGCLAIRLVFGAFPSSAATFDLSKPEQGLTLFILSGVQAFVGLWLSGFRCPVPSSSPASAASSASGSSPPLALPRCSISLPPASGSTRAPSSTTWCSTPSSTPPEAPDTSRSTKPLSD
jgi:predicted MFS family arabinose efflux permease